MRFLSWSWNAEPGVCLTIFTCVLDLEKAFHSIPQNVLWQVLWEYGVYKGRGEAGLGTPQCSPGLAEGVG